jgi:hypothetical protein
MKMDNAEDTTTTENTATSGEIVDVEPEPIKRKRGRPGKASSSSSDEQQALPLTPEPPPKAKKTAEEMKDPGAAIRRYIDSIGICMVAYSELHPESDLAWVWSELRARLPAEKDRLGAPMGKTAFHAPVVALCKAGQYIGDLEPDEMPSKEDYDRVEQSWATASTHLGMTAKMAALATAGSETVGVVVFTLVKGVHRWITGPKPNKKAKPEIDADERPASSSTSSPATSSPDGAP